MRLQCADCIALLEAIVSVFGNSLQRHTVHVHAATASDSVGGSEPKSEHVHINIHFKLLHG